MDSRSAHDAASDHLIVDSVGLDKYDDGTTEELDAASGLRRKRELEDDYDDEEDDDTASNDYSKDDELKDGKAVRPGNKRSRRHNWQPRYEMEFGLIAIERDATTGDVTLAMCGFCKAFGREGKYEQLLQADAEAGNETKKRRKRSLTTTKFFRAFRVDNIRSHLLGAHPRRWAEYDMLPKQEAVRSRYLQMQGELQYDGLHMVDDVVLSGSTLNAEHDNAYAQAQAQALGHTAIGDSHQVCSTVPTATTAGLNGANPAGAHLTGYNGKTSSSQLLEAAHVRQRNDNMVAAGLRMGFDYERHLADQLALERERLEFEKARFKKEVELRERELVLREKQLEQERVLHEKLMASNQEQAQSESSKFLRLAEVLREAITSAHAAGVSTSEPSVV